MIFGNDKHAAYLRSLNDPRRMEAVRELTARLCTEYRERKSVRERSEQQRDYDEYRDEQGLTPSAAYWENR